MNELNNDHQKSKFVLKLAQTKALAVEAVKAKAFPNEFKKGFIESLDKRFVIILFLTFVVGYGGMLGLLLTNAFAVDPDVYKQKVKNAFLVTVLKKPAQAIVKKEEVKPDDKAVDEDKPADAASAKSLDKTDKAAVEKYEEAREVKKAAAAAEYKKNVAAQASAVLAQLTARSRGARTGGSSAGSAVDVLGNAQGGSNLGDVLAGAQANAGKGIGLGTATRADIGRGAGGVGKLGAIGSGAGLGAGSGVGDALERGGAGIKAKISTGKVKSAGSSSRGAQELEQVIAEQTRAINSCYEAEKAKDPTLKGSITIGFQIAQDGRVQGPRVVSTTMKNTNLERCIINKVRLWQFSAVTDPKPQQLEVPYNFTD